METYNVTCSTDSKYTQHCMAMLCSLFDTNRNNHFHIHLLHHLLPEEHMNLIKGLCERYGEEITFYDINEEKLGNVIINHEHLSISTYYRLLLPSLLKEDIHRILYLDCDVLVCRDISGLFRLDMDDYGVAAVCDYSPYLDFQRRIVGIGLEDKMFCAGVMLINMDYWRKNDCQAGMLDFICRTGENLLMEDQDVLNHEFRRHWLQLPYKYGKSTMSVAVLNDRQRDFDIQEYVEKPVIYHFASVKPWLDIKIPESKYYWKYVRLSGFPNPVEEKATAERKRYVKILKARYYINFYIRPFIPNLIEIILIDIADILLLFYHLLFCRSKFKMYHVRRWLRKYNY